MTMGGDQFGDEINYYGAGAESTWVVAETYATAGEWHAAKGILARNGIVAKMRSTADPDGGYDLLILQTELEWARELLESQGQPNPFEAMTHGFPMDPDPSES